MKTLYYISAIALLFHSCEKSNVTYTPDCSGAAKSFASDVAPLVKSYCATNGCHTTGSTKGPGALETYSQIYNNRTKIRSAVANGTMPENTSLSNTQKNAILCWIDAGAPNN